MVFNAFFAIFVDSCGLFLTIWDMGYEIWDMGYGTECNVLQWWTAIVSEKGKARVESTKSTSIPLSVTDESRSRKHQEQGTVQNNRVRESLWLTEWWKHCITWNYPKETPKGTIHIWCQRTTQPRILESHPVMSFGSCTIERKRSHWHWPKILVQISTKVKHILK